MITLPKYRGNQINFSSFNVYPVCYNATMNTHLELSADLEAVLQQIAAREKRDVNDVIQDALQRYAAENSRAMPSWVGIGEGLSDLSERVDELLFADCLRP